MRTRIRKMLWSVSALLALVAGSGFAETIVWNGAGANGKWTTTNNWAGGILPLSTDTAEFGSGFASGNVNVDAPQTVAGLIVNHAKSGGLYVAGANALTLSGTIRRTGGTSHLYVTCPVTLADTLTITNQAIGITQFSVVNGSSDIYYQDNLGTHLEFIANNRGTFSGDIYVTGMSSNNVIASYKDGGFGTGNIYMYGCTMLKFRGEAQTVSNNIAIKETRALEWGANTTNAFYNHVGNITIDAAYSSTFYLKGTNTTVRLSGNNTGPTGSRIILCGSSEHPSGKYIIGNTAALSWGYTVIAYTSSDIAVMLEDGVAITNNSTQLRDDVTARVTLGNETAGATNLISTLLNVGNFGTTVSGNRTLRLVAATGGLVRATGRIYESNAADVLNIVKDGPGAVALSYANDYKGVTVISNGTLLANNVTGSATSTNSVTVCAGGALGGTGTVKGDVTVQANGCVSPGDAVGKLTVSNLTFEAGAVYAWDYTATTQDLLRATGTLALPATLTVTVNNLSGDYVPHAGVVMMESSGTLTGTPDGWTVAAPNSVRLSDSGKQVLLCGPVQGTLIKVN